MIHLRAATQEDCPFLWRLVVETMKGYVEETCGWDEGYQRERFQLTFKPECIQIIQCEEVSIGLWEVARNEDPWLLQRIAIRPEFQNRGIGGRLVSDLLSEAEEARCGVALQVLRVNPARQLYARLGFQVTGENATHIQMSRPFCGGASPDQVCPGVLRIDP
jgi:GNAT superfamily N-acetyltransferase